MGASADLAVEAVFREVSGQAVATLVRLVGDISTAEDAVQDAFVVAMNRWPVDGVPPNPAGWIVTTARRRAIDQHRRTARGRELNNSLAPPVHGEVENHGPVVDDRLRLIFTCCHPSLRQEHQIALTLRLLGGLSIAEIADAFLVTEAAMTKRLTRAKYKITAAAIPYEVPRARDLPERVDACLAVLYLVYNAGSRDPAEGSRLRREATRLARALTEMLPHQPEPWGLLALMLLDGARLPARRHDGEVVLLRAQDRSRWDRAAIREGQAIVRRCIEVNRPGPYQLQAAIQAVHCDAGIFDDTDWAQIVMLYDHLASITASPVVVLNRAIAVAERDGPDAALALVEPLRDRLDAYAPFHTARGSFLVTLGRDVEAAAEYTRAAELSQPGAERDHLTREAVAARARIAACR